VLAWLCFRVECTQSAVMLPWYAKNDCNRIWHYKWLSQNYPPTSTP